jgi:hypothetical protein
MAMVAIIVIVVVIIPSVWPWAIVAIAIESTVISVEASAATLGNTEYAGTALVNPNTGFTFTPGAAT